MAILSLNVDNILLAKNCQDIKNKINSFLASKFEMKYMDVATYVLGIRIYRNIDFRLLKLDQEKYLENGLKGLTWIIVNL